MHLIYCLLNWPSEVFKNKNMGKAWVVQSVEHLTLDLGSGHDPRVMESSPELGSVLNVEPA